MWPLLRLAPDLEVEESNSELGHPRVDRTGLVAERLMKGGKQHDHDAIRRLPPTQRNRPPRRTLAELGSCRYSPSLRTGIRGSLGTADLPPLTSPLTAGEE